MFNFNFLRWGQCDGSKIEGREVPGNPDAPPTRWWTWRPGWKKRAVFSVSPEAAERGYRLGYKPMRGPDRLLGVVLHHPRFQARIGHEDCTFFAIDVDGKEVPLKLVVLAIKGHDRYHFIGLTERGEEYMSRELLAVVRDDPQLKRIPLF